MDDERIAAADKPPALAVVVSPEEFASALAALGAAEHADRCRGEPGRRVLVLVEDDAVDALGPRGMRFSVGSGFDVEIEGRKIYLVEGESSPHPFDLTLPPVEFEGKLVLSEPKPNQESGFYRRFEQRRRDGSTKRGRR